MGVSINKNAFTVMELIFVILLLGILAAIIMQKLSASRGDAEKVSFISNVKVCISDLGTNSMAKNHIIDNDYISSFHSCNQANEAVPSSIEANSTNSIRVSNTNTVFDGIHTFGGTCKICGNH